MKVEHYCEVCGCSFGGNKCPNSKYHPKMQKIASLLPDGTDAVKNYETYKLNSYDDLSRSSKSVDYYVDAYVRLVFSYYVRFQWSHKWGSSITFETYMAMMLHSGIYEDEKHTEAISKLKEKYGDVYGIKKGYTYVFEDGIERYIENSLFLAYYTDDGFWTIIEKNSGESRKVSDSKIRKSAKDDYVFGYAKCLFDDIISK